MDFFDDLFGKKKEPFKLNLDPVPKYDPLPKFEPTSGLDALRKIDPLAKLNPLPKPDPLPTVNLNQHTNRVTFGGRIDAGPVNTGYQVGFDGRITNGPIDTGYQVGPDRRVRQGPIDTGLQINESGRFMRDGRSVSGPLPWEKKFAENRLEPPSPFSFGPPKHPWER